MSSDSANKKQEVILAFSFMVNVLFLLFFAGILLLGVSAYLMFPEQYFSPSHSFANLMLYSLSLVALACCIWFWKLVTSKSKRSVNLILATLTIPFAIFVLIVRHIASMA